MEGISDREAYTPGISLPRARDATTPIARIPNRLDIEDSFLATETESQVVTVLVMVIVGLDLAREDLWREAASWRRTAVGGQKR